MPTKTEDGWVCSICGEVYPRDVYALSCEQSHEIIYVPIKFGDLRNLIEFLFTKNDKLLTESLVKTLMKYSRKIGR